MMKFLKFMTLFCVLSLCNMVRPEGYDPTFEFDGFRAGGRNSLAASPDIVIGKESELLHFSLDLKWLYRGLTNPNAWRALGNSIVLSLKRLHPGFNNEITYKENALNRITDLTRYNPNLDMKVFGRSLSRAAELAWDENKLVLVCIEEGVEGLVPSADTLQMHMALASENCSKLLNEHFVVLLADSSHAYAQEVVRLYMRHLLTLAPLHMEYPLVVALRPMHSQPFPSSSSTAVSATASPPAAQRRGKVGLEVVGGWGVGSWEAHQSLPSLTSFLEHIMESCGAARADHQQSISDNTSVDAHSRGAPSDEVKDKFTIADSRNHTNTTVPANRNANQKNATEAWKEMYPLYRHLTRIHRPSYLHKSRTKGDRRLKDSSEDEHGQDGQIDARSP